MFALNKMCGSEEKTKTSREEHSRIWSSTKEEQDLDLHEVATNGHFITKWQKIATLLQSH